MLIIQTDVIYVIWKYNYYIDNKYKNITLKNNQIVFFKIKKLHLYI